MEKEFVINWFAQNSARTKEELINNPDINYLEENIIDSFGFLELIGACENEFSIEFDDNDFSNDYIFTVSGLIDIIKNKK